MKNWNLLKIIGPVLAVLIPVFATYQIFYQSDGAKRDIEIEELWISGSLSFLRDLDERVELKIDKKNVSNISIAHFSIENIGKKEIEAADFHKNLEVKVDEPWEIIGISTDWTKPKDVELEWNRVDDREFELGPMLINPSDYYQVLIYLTNNKFDSSADENEKPEIQWNARVKNLHNIKFKGREQSNVNYFIRIYFERFDAVWFVLISTILTFLTSFLLISSIGKIFSTVHTILFTIITGAISITSATIITGNILGYSMGGYNGWPIWLICGLHFIALSLSFFLFMLKNKEGEN